MGDLTQIDNQTNQKELSEITTLKPFRHQVNMTLIR